MNRIILSFFVSGFMAVVIPVSLLPWTNGKWQPFLPSCGEVGGGSRWREFITRTSVDCYACHRLQNRANGK